VQIICLAQSQAYEMIENPMPCKSRKSANRYPRILNWIASWIVRHGTSV